MQTLILFLGEKKKKRKISRLYCGSVWVYGYVILMGGGGGGEI